MRKLSLEKTIFHSLLIIHVIYVWVMPVFLTQDGPSHLYNSKILLDLFSGNGIAFYQQYIELNLSVFPNWYSSVFLSFFLSVFSPIISEKIFISLLIISIPLSFRYALKAINPNALFLSSLIFIISNSYFLIYGFYNFQWSIVFFFIFIGYYLYSYKTLSIKQSLLISIILLLTFSAHPIALIQMYFLLGIEFIICILALVNKKASDKKQIITRTIKIAFIVLPSMFLFIIFFYQQHNNNSSLLENNFSYQSIITLMNASHLWVFSSIEKIILGIFSILAFLYAGISYIKRDKLTKNQHSTNLIFLIVFNAFVYFFISDKLTGGAYLNSRITIFIYAILIMYAGSFSFKNKVKKIHLYTSLTICIFLIAVRFPNQYKIGVLAKKYITVVDKIKDGSTVLPLGFSNKGNINSKVLSPVISVFKHMSGYIGASKKTISFDNYEANTKYFPLIWKEHQNPYKHISAGSEDGIEQSPPNVDILSYNKRKSSSIDYVILWGDQTTFYDSIEFKNLNDQLKKEYQLVEKSEDNLTYLYIKKQ